METEDRKPVVRATATPETLQPLQLHGRVALQAPPEGAYNPLKLIQADIPAAIKNLEAILAEPSIGRVVLDPDRLATWTESIEELKWRAKKENRFTVAIVGQTGAGKSALVNALLDWDLLPTSSMRACTTAVVEVRGGSDKKTRGEVEFLTAAEVIDELALMRQDLTNEDGEPADVTDNEAAEAAWSKLVAIYPDLTLAEFFQVTNEALCERGRAGWVLGTTHEFTAKDRASFVAELASYADAKEKDLGDGQDQEKREAETWPLIKRIAVSLPRSFLSTGAVLVDLPGVQDANAARSKVASDYLKVADAIFIVAQQSRAVDDKAASDILGQAFKRQLLLDNALSRVAFIATQSDHLNIAEVARARPKAGQGVGKLDAYIAARKQELGKLKISLGESESAIRQLQKDLRDAEDELNRQSTTSSLRSPPWTSPDKKPASPDATSDPEDPLLGRKRRQAEEAAKREKKRRKSSQGVSQKASVASALPSIAQDQSPLASLKQLGAEVQKQLAQQAELRKKIGTAEKDIDEAEKEKWSVCVHERNLYVEGGLQKGFRRVMKALDEQAGREPQNYSKVHVPVFCVSSTEYRRLVDEEKSHVFSSTSETNIPALRRHIREIALTPTYPQAMELIKLISDLADDLRHFFNGESDVAVPDAAAFKKAFHAHLREVEPSLIKIIDTAVDTIEASFEDLDPVLAQGVEDAVNGADGAWDPSYASLRHNTWRAVLVRSGKWANKRASYNLNAELLSPFLDKLSVAWSKLFESPTLLLDGFSDAVLEIADGFVAKLAEAAVTGSPSREFDTVQAKCANDLKTQLDTILGDIGGIIEKQQKEYTRDLAPVLAGKMSDTYKAAAVPRGKGSMKASKGAVHSFIVTQGQGLFAPVQEKLLSDLETLVNIVADHLTDQIPRLIGCLKLNYTSLWQKIELLDKQSTERRAMFKAAVEKEREDLGKIRSRMVEAPAPHTTAEQDEVSEESDSEDGSDVWSDEEVDGAGKTTLEQEDYYAGDGMLVDGAGDLGEDIDMLADEATA